MVLLNFIIVLFFILYVLISSFKEMTFETMSCSVELVKFMTCPNDSRFEVASFNVALILAMVIFKFAMESWMLVSIASISFLFSSVKL